MDQPDVSEVQPVRRRWAWLRTKTRTAPLQRSADPEKSVDVSSPLPHQAEGVGDVADHGRDSGLDHQARSYKDDLLDEATNIAVRLRVFGSVAVTSLIDLVFLLVWALLHKASQWGLQQIGDLAGVGDVMVQVLQWIFDVATLLVVVVYVVRDLVLSVRRIWRIM